MRLVCADPAIGERVKIPSNEFGAMCCGGCKKTRTSRPRRCWNGWGMTIPDDSPTHSCERCNAGRSNGVGHPEPSGVSGSVDKRGVCSYHVLTYLVQQHPITTGRENPPPVVIGLVASYRLFVEPPEVGEEVFVEAGFLEAAQLGIDAVDGEQVEHGQDVDLLPLPVGDFF